MKVADILRCKGARLITIRPGETIATLSRVLQRERVGAVIVSHDGQTIDGMISERDIAYALANRRGELHLLPVSALMTRRVVTLSLDDAIADAARIMAEHHIRHLPILDGNRLAGLISIRDVLEHRLEELRELTRKLGSMAGGG